MPRADDHGLRQRADGSWTFRIEYPRKADGTRDQRTITVRGTRTFAKAERTRLKAEAAGGLAPDSGRMTVAQFLDHWLATHVQRNCARATQEGYEEVVRVYAAPFLGHHRLDRLRPLHLEAYFTHLRTQGGRDGRALSAGTAGNHYAILRAAFRRAVRWGLLARSPLDAVELAPQRRKAPTMATPAQLAQLLAASRATPRLYLLILLGATTGLRRAELTALRWQDVDLDAGLLHVRAARVQYRNENTVGEPKSESSRRTVTLPPALVAELVKARAEQAAARLRLGPLWQDGGWVLCKDNGAPWAPGSAYNCFRRLCVREGLPAFTVHQLRHGHASDQLARGVPLPNVRARLGHARNSTTADLYAHALAQYEDQAAAAAEAALSEVLFGRR